MQAIPAALGLYRWGFINCEPLQNVYAKNPESLTTVLPNRLPPKQA